MADGLDFGQYADTAKAVDTAVQPNDNVGLSMPASSGVLSPTSQTTFGNAIAYGLPSLGIGLLDTLGQSLHITNNNTVPDALRSLTGTGENSLGDFYTRNQAAMRAGGEILGIALPGKIAMDTLKTVNGLREAGSIGAWAKNSTALDVLLGSSADMAAAQKAVSTTMSDAITDQGIWAGRTLATPEVIAAKRTYYAKRAVDAARTTMAFELGNFTAFNTSQVMYPADMTYWDQAKWSGAGLAAGLGIDYAVGRYVVRTMAQAAIKASSQDLLSPLQKDADKVLFRPQKRGVGITAYAGMDADLNNTISVSNNPAQLKTNLTQDQVNIKKILSEQIYQGGRDKGVFVGQVNLEQPQIDLGLKALKKNPTSMMFMTSIGQVPENHVDFYGNIAKVFDDANKDYNTAIFAASNKFGEKTPEFYTAQIQAITALSPIEKAASELHYVLEPTGDWTVFKNRAANYLDSNSLDTLKYKPYTTPNPADEDKALKNTKLISTANQNVVLHDNGRLELPKTPTPMDFSTSYAMGSKLIANWKPVDGQQFILTPGMNWRQLEVLSGLIEKYPQARQAVKFGPGFTSMDDVNFHILNQKVMGLLDDLPSTSTAPISNSSSLLAKIGTLGKNLTPAQLLQKYNLPTPQGFNDAPLMEMVAHMKLQGMDDLNDMFPKPNEGRAFEQPYTQLDLVKKHLQETAGITDNTPVPFQGNLLNQTSDTKPLFVAASAVPMTSMADTNISTRVQAMRDVQLQKLSHIDPNASPLISGVVGKLITTGNEGGDLSGAANSARAVQTLQDGVLSGSGVVVYQDRINEQFPTLKALQLLAQDGDHYITNYVGELASKDLTPRYANMLSQKNRIDLLDFNRIEQAYRHGWDISGMEASSGNGGVRFTLNQDSKINKQLFAEHFPGEEEMPAYMPDMSVTAKKQGMFDLRVSQAAGDLAQAISAMSIQSGRENNILRAALGKSPITIRDFHLPTPELNKEGTWFVRNPVGRVIAAYTGPNFAQNQQRALGAATTLGEGHIAVPLDTVKAEHQINDDHFFSLIDYSDQLAKTGAAIKGGLAHTEIDNSAFTLKAMIKSLQEQYLNIGIRSRAAVFEPELNYARQAAQTATAGTRENLGNINIFDRYISTMFSQTPRGPQGAGALGRVYGGIEDGLDKSLTWLYGHYTSMLPSESNQVGAKIVNSLLRKQSSAAEYKQFSEQLPEWSPFTDAEKFRESFFKEASPPSVRKIAGQLARLSSTMSLRFLDMGTAINNFAGLMTNAPSVVTGLRKLSNESTEQWISRTGAYGTQLTDGVMTFSPMKAISAASKALWKGELTQPMMDAAKHGYFTPEYASLAQALTLPEKPSEQALQRFVRYASYGADKSEMLSRQLAWGMGYKIGKDLHGFDDERNAYIFANNFVNDMIGNYSPNNKPVMFQGAVGLPLGAFQTYMSNFYRRLYGYVEKGDKASILSQYAAQASIFGAKSVPGYGLWNSVFQSNDTKTTDFTSRTESTFSPGVGELILNGSLSNIPKIFGGLQGDGFSFYTRGSVDYTQPVPTLLDMSKAPPIQFLTDVFGGIKATIGNVFGAGGFSLQQQEEILANFSTNRAMKSIMEMAANAKTDQRGNVVQYGTRDAMHVAAAMMGTQLSSVRSMQEATNRQRDIQLAQEDLQATLSAHTKAILRGGNLSVSDLQGIVNNYITNGGNPAYLGQWFRNDLMNATEPKAQLQLESLAKSGKMLEFEDALASMQQNSKNPMAANPQVKGTQ